MYSDSLKNLSPTPYHILPSIQGVGGIAASTNNTAFFETSVHLAQMLNQFLLHGISRIDHHSHCYEYNFNVCDDFIRAVPPSFSGVWCSIPLQEPGMPALEWL